MSESLDAKVALVHHMKTANSLVQPMDWSKPHDYNCPGCIAEELAAELSAARTIIRDLVEFEYPKLNLVKMHPSPKGVALWTRAHKYLRGQQG